MEWLLLIVAALVGLLLGKRARTQTTPPSGSAVMAPELSAKAPETPPWEPPEREGVRTYEPYLHTQTERHYGAILWAHKTPAGFVAVGFSVDTLMSETQVLVQNPQLIYPTFINPEYPLPKNKPDKVEGHKWGWMSGPDMPVFIRGEMQEEPNAPGGYIVLQPLNHAKLLGSSAVGRMLFPDVDALAKMRAEYSGKDKSFTLPRAYPFPRSKLYQVQSNLWGSIYGAYFYPVLLEISL